jgi:uncharacterized protein YeaO (DUF488 family)
MKKLVIILTILVLNNLKATSQTVLDSTTAIPNTQLRKAINIIEKGKLVQQELDLTKQEVDFLDKRIQKKDSIIFNYAQKDIEWNKFYKNYQIELRNNKEYQSNTQSIFERQTILIKRNKYNKWIFLAAGLGAGIMLHK